MNDILNYLLSAAAWWIWLLAAALVAAIVYIRHDSFLVTDLSYRFPVIGKLARFSRDYSETKRGGWLNVEASLCHDYARHVSALSKAEFDRNSEYLRRAYDHGRKPMPAGVFGLVSLLVVLEGLGFSYLLSTWMAIESSENERMLLTAAIVIVLAAILVWVTHAAGHQLYRTRLLRSCFQQFQAGLIEEPESEDGVVRPPAPRVYSSEIISLDQDQSRDEKMPAHVRCANRVVTRPDDLGTFTWVWVAALLVIFIAVVSTILRIETLESSDLSAGSSIVPAIFQGGAPANVSGDVAAAARKYAALSSFGILSVIFVVTQLVGMGVGFRYGFAAKQGREAHAATRGCADYESYFRPIRRRMSIADLRLTTLHRLMEKRLPHEINWSRDFIAFIKEERERGATDLQDPTNLEPTAGPSPAQMNGSHALASQPSEGPAKAPDRPNGGEGAVTQ